MGREVCKVPPHWNHPRDERGEYKSMYAHRSFEEDVAEWKAGYAKWEEGEHPDYCGEEDKSLEFWEFHGMPPADREMYHPWKDEEATWYQLWQTVSEGSPVSPPFETKEELIEYLAKNGDAWDQKRGVGGWGYERAKAFVDDGWAPSMMVSGGRIFESKDIPLEFQKAP
jgi:hypothetical protein